MGAGTARPLKIEVFARRARGTPRAPIPKNRGRAVPAPVLALDLSIDCDYPPG